MSNNNEGMRFSPKPTKSKTFCCVYNCSSKACRDITVRFHHLPKPGECLVLISNKFGNLERIDRRKAWDIVLKSGKPMTDSMRVCSLHFKETDYLRPRKCIKFNTHVMVIIIYRIFMYQKQSVYSNLFVSTNFVSRRGLFIYCRASLR